MHCSKAVWRSLEDLASYKLWCWRLLKAYCFWSLQFGGVWDFWVLWIVVLSGCVLRNGWCASNSVRLEVVESILYLAECFSLQVLSFLKNVSLVVFECVVRSVWCAWCSPGLEVLESRPSLAIRSSLWEVWDISFVGIEWVIALEWSHLKTPWSEGPLKSCY